MKIFVQIASYRDPELEPTIQSCLENAKYPENIVFAICRQYHPEDEFGKLENYREDIRFRIVDVLYNESKGTCWARNIVQQLYNQEEFTLQIDSHMRFEKDWDETLINMVLDLQKKGHNKPLITTYAPSYNPQRDPIGRVNRPWFMKFDKFTPEGVVFFLPSPIDDKEKLTDPVPASFYSAHFCFTLGKFTEEVKHNPDFYFHGEEISITVRAFTHGYDLFHPNKVIIWHEYTRSNRTKQWDDDTEWWVLNEKALLLNRQLFGMDGHQQEGHDGEYGFGNVRTLSDYELYAGINFKHRSAHPKTLKGDIPPINDNTNWYVTPTTKFEYSIIIPKIEIIQDDYDFWAISFLDDLGSEIFREDAVEKEIKEIYDLKSDYIVIKRSFLTNQNIKSWSIWTHHKENGWIKQVTGEV